MAAAAPLHLGSCLFTVPLSLPRAALPAPRLRCVEGKAAASLSRSSAASRFSPTVLRLLVPPARPQRQADGLLGPDLPERPRRPCSGGPCASLTSGDVETLLPVPPAH